jgi:small ligand-binding sensory domain FIST
MATRAGAGISFEDGGVDAFAEAAARAAMALGGAGADLAVVFAGPANLDHAEEGVAAVSDRLRPTALAGCGAQGVLGGGREIESGGVCVWAAAFEGGEVEPFHAEALEAGGAVTVAGMPDLDGADAAILLADPYTFPAEPLLEALAEEHPGVPVVGGIASGGPGPAALLNEEGALAGGAVGAVLRGVELHPCVSQGARPVGPEMAVTRAEGNVIHELASQPALERLKRAIAELDAHERALASRGLLLGLVVDPNKPDYERGDFLVRGLVGVDEESGALAAAAEVHVGQTVRMHVRDAASAHEDLMHTLDREAASLTGPPAGALLFTCNGRGQGMFGVPDHDARAVAEAFGNVPTGGFFCAGEIGPVGGRSFVHGFTATVAAFPA